MSPETSEITSEFTTAAGNYVINFNETELTLGLPGESRRKLEKKRQFSDLKSSRGEYSDTECSDATKHPPIEELVVGWPPVALRRKNVMNSNFRFVKVAVDGAPYLRKLDLESCSDYEQLHCALKEIFSYFTIENELIMKRLMDVVIVNGITIRYVSTYEDEDGDWMLVGDVPWRMFVRTCKRIRLMKSSDAINGLAS